MRKTLSGVWQRSLLLITVIFVAALFPGCKPPPLPQLPVRKVIVTHLGEVIKEARYVGETIRYKIYFANHSRQKADVGIVDRLDPNLGEVVPLNHGMYDRINHLVAWKIEKVPPGGGGFVEFEAVIGGGTIIRDQALLQIGGPFDPVTVDPVSRDIIKTNVVETLVRPNPELGWIPFDRAAAEGALPRAALKEETTLGTLVRFDVPGLYAQKILVDDVTFHRLAIPRHTTLLDLGKPELPIVGQIIEIPKDVNFTLEIVQSQSRKLDYY